MQIEFRWTLDNACANTVPKGKIDLERVQNDKRPRLNRAAPPEKTGLEVRRTGEPSLYPLFDPTLHKSSLNSRAKVWQLRGLHVAHPRLPHKPTSG